jgi:tetratricopeptide (TPR) repeat protein
MTLARRLASYFAIAAVLALGFDVSAQRRGGGGRGGGGGFHGGFGGGRPSGGGMSRPAGGGAVSRPSLPSSNRPQVSRPSMPSVNRPSIPQNRPSLPNTGGNRPNIERPTTRPSLPNTGGNRPNIERPTTRPSLPGTGGSGGNRPTLPGAGSGGVNRPSLPGTGSNRPSTLPATRPGAGNRPSLPGLGGGTVTRPNLPGGNHHQNLQDRWGDRNNWYPNNFNDRMNHFSTARDSWYHHYSRWHDYHGHWHHGWCGGNNWSNYWDHMWSAHPVWSAFAVTHWSLNTASWLFGLNTYANPYYVSGSSGYDYSQPLIIEQSASPATSEAEAAPAVNDEAMSAFDQAREAFQGQNYADALAKINEAIKKMPQDAALHEFKALCHFALGDYKNACITLYAVLSVGPGWDWTTMYNLYGDIDVYTGQLRKLEDYCRNNKESAEAYFVLGYHYLTMDKKDLAIRMYQVVAKLAPNDKVTKQLLEGLGAQPVTESTPVEKENATPAIPAEKLAGNWKAGGPNNTSFTLDMTKEGDFTWAYTANGKTDKVKGSYAQQGGNLVLETEAGTPMVADVALKDDGTLSFQMTGQPDAVKLVFKK